MTMKEDIVQARLAMRLPLPNPYRDQHDSGAQSTMLLPQLVHLVLAERTIWPASHRGQFHRVQKRQTARPIAPDELPAAASPASASGRRSENELDFSHPEVAAFANDTDGRAEDVDPDRVEEDRGGTPALFLKEGGGCDAGARGDFPSASQSVQLAAIEEELKTKLAQIRIHRKEAKFLDDYVVLDSQRRKRGPGPKCPSPDRDVPQLVDGKLASEAGATLRQATAKARRGKFRTAPPPDRRIYGCLFCDHMGRKKMWLLHLRSKHSDRNLVFCDASSTCQMPCESPEQLQRHIDLAHEKKLCCPVSGCGRLFRHKASLCEHQRSHFPNGTEQQPEVAAATLQSNDHAESSAYVCTFCGKKYRTRAGFRAHEAMVHTKKLKHECKHDGCGMAFFNLSDLKVHQRKHTGELPFTCAFCGARYVSNATLVQHEKAAHLQTEDEECQVCRKRLRKRNMRSHMRTHDGYQGIPCSVCGKEFPTLGGKNRHEKIHFMLKQHVCRFCGKSFVQKVNMQAHERIHTGERPFKCQHCGEGFPQQTRRNQHQLSCQHKAADGSSGCV